MTQVRPVTVEPDEESAAAYQRQDLHDVHLGRRPCRPGDFPDDSLGVFARYVLGTGSSWPEPTAILLMMVFTFIGAAASYRAGAHMAVAMLTDRMPPQLRAAAAISRNCSWRRSAFS